MNITNALNYATSPYGFKPLTVEDTIKMVGEGLKRLIEKFLAASGDLFSSANPPECGLRRGDNNVPIKDTVLGRFIKYYSEHLADFTKTYPLESLSNSDFLIDNMAQLLTLIEKQ